MASGSVRASTSIPHDGADLYRALVRLPAITQAGSPSSAWTRWRSTLPVDETYHDLDVEPPAALLSFDDPQRAPGEWRSLDVAAFHEERYRHGDVELALTCMELVRNELRRRGVPVVRVEHTRAALREALRRASLTDRLARTQASQTAIALVEPRQNQRRGANRGPTRRSESIFVTDNGWSTWQSSSRER